MIHGGGYGVLTGCAGAVLPGLASIATGLVSGKYRAPVLPQAASAQTTSSRALLIIVLNSPGLTACLMFFVPQA
jgi:hypothetical protein